MGRSGGKGSGAGFFFLGLLYDDLTDHLGVLPKGSTLVRHLFRIYAHAD